MSVDYTSKPPTEPGLGESDTPMFAGVPSWERNRKRRTFGGKPRATAAVVTPEPVVTRNAAYVEPNDTAFAAEPVYATRTVKRGSAGVAPLAIAAGIMAIGGLAAAGWYASQPRETGIAQLTPGTESTALPATTEIAAAEPSAPLTQAAPAPTAMPTKAAPPAPRATTRVATAAPARARPAATSNSAMEAGVNTSATLPSAPQPYSGSAVGPSAPADVGAPAASTTPAPAPLEASPPATPPTAATPPADTPPSS